MNLFKVILLFFIYISPLKANTIYNLIKIPNLEVYEIDTKNKLKYFYATKPFRLGVEKNIICLNTSKKNLDNKINKIKKNLNRYSVNFLKKINLKYIVLCEDLSISGINTAGIPDNIMKTLILDINFNKTYFERTIHHEVFHIINDSFAKSFNEEKWKNFNNKRFNYAECSTCNGKVNLELYKNTKGFFSEYSKTIPSEDMAEVFSFMMTLSPEQLNQIIKNDYILDRKTFFIRNRILKIESNFRFPGAMKATGEIF